MLDGTDDLTCLWYFFTVANRTGGQNWAPIPVAAASEKETPLNTQKCILALNSGMVGLGRVSDDQRKAYILPRGGRLSCESPAK